MHADPYVNDEWRSTRPPTTATQGEAKRLASMTGHRRVMLASGCGSTSAGMLATTEAARGGVGSPASSLDAASLRLIDAVAGVVGVGGP